MHLGLSIITCRIRSLAFYYFLQFCLFFRRPLTTRQIEIFIAKIVIAAIAVVLLLVVFNSIIIVVFNNIYIVV